MSKILMEICCGSAEDAIVAALMGDGDVSGLL